MAATLYYSNILGYCISVDEKLLSFQNKWYAQNLTNLVFCPRWSDHVTLMPKYGHKTAPGSVSTPNVFVISIQKMTWNNCSYLLPQALSSTPPPPSPPGLTPSCAYYSALSWQKSLSYKTSPLICSSNQWTGFHMTGTSVMKKLK